MQFVGKLLVFPVDTSAHTDTTELGVDVECEVKKRGTGGEPVQVAFGGEHEHFLVVDIHPEITHKFHRALLGAFQNVAHIVHPCVEVAFTFDAFVAPVRCQPFFGHKIHAPGAYLHFHPFPFRA